MFRSKLSLTPVVAALLVLTAGGAAAGNEATAPSAEVSTLAGSTGCGRTPTLNNGTHTIQSGGTSRSFILRLPDGYNNTRPYRLVFGFHWLGGSATDVATGRTVNTEYWQYYGLLRLSNSSTIFVAPQGISNGWANTSGWDVTFVDNMLQRIESDLCVETTQRFSVGFSYGGAMSYALACARPHVFRAVAIYGSPGLISGCSGGTEPVAYFHAHGVADDIGSGRSQRDRFVRNNGCTAQNPPEPARDSRTHFVTTYSGCRAGYPVVWAPFDGGHDASPADGQYRDAPAAVKGQMTWLPGETWRFFTQFQGGPDPSPGIPTGWARITNVTTGLVLDSGGSVASGSQLKQWTYDGSTNLQWQLVDVGGGYYRLVNRTNGMVADSGGNGANGAPAVQAPWNGGNNQQWRLNSMGNGRYQIINRGTGTCLDSGGVTTSGSGVKLWAAGASTNLQWTIAGTS